MNPARSVSAGWPEPRGQDVADPPARPARIVATWNAAVPGDSPVDDYEVTINGSDGSGTFTQTVSGTTLTALFTVDYIPDWTVTVRAHNAAGWGSLAYSFRLGGLESALLRASGLPPAASP